MATPSERSEEKAARRPGLWGRRWFRRLSIGAAVSLALFTVVGFFVLPPVIRHVAESQLREQLGRRASIGALHVNPFALSLGIDDFEIYESDGVAPFVGWKRFYVNVKWASLLRRAPVVQEVRLEGLHVHVVHTRQTDGGFGDLAAYNFSDILAKLQADAGRKPPAPPEPPRAEPPRFSLNNIHLSEGTVTFDDRPTGGHHELAHLSIGVPFVSTLPVDVDTFVKPGLALALDGTPFAIEGQTKPFKGSLETTLELRLTALDLARYQAYVPLPLKFRLDSGKLTVALDLSFVRLGDVPSVNLKGHVSLDQLAVRQVGTGGAPVLDLATLNVELGRADLSAMDFHVDKLALSGLDLYARRLHDGQLDLLRLLPEEPAAPAGHTPGKEREKRKATSHAAPGVGPRFTVDELALDNINLHLRDETVRPVFVETVRGLAVHVAHLSNAPGARATMTAHLTAVPGGVLSQSGTLSLQPFAVAGSVTLDGVEPGRFAPYYQEQLAFDVTEGRVRLGTGYHVASAGPRTVVSLDDAFVELSNVKLRRRAAPGKPAPEDFFRLADLAVRKVGVDLDAHTVKVGEIASHDLRLRAGRNEAGVVDLTTLLAPSPAEKTGVTPARPAVAPAAASPAPAAPAWSVDVADVRLDGWGARFEDRAVKPKAIITVEGLGLHAASLSTKPGSRATFEVKATLNQTGKLQVGGSAVAEPMAANLRFDLRDIAILPLQPYFRDSVNLVVTDGAVSLKGQLKAETPPGPKGHAQPRLAFTGDFDVAHFDALDGHKNEKLLSWKSFHVGGIDFASTPPSISVREIALADYTAKLMIFPDAHFNLQDIAAPSATPASSAAIAATPRATPVPPAAARGKAAEAPASASAPVRVTVGQVTLQGGDVSFTDRLIKPNYSTQLTELGGRVSGLSSDPQSTAEVSLRGAVDHSGTLTIDGKMNPLGKDLFVDLRIRLSDFELPPTSPYAARYAGYGIEKGKLSLSLDYRIAGRKLEAKNKLTLDQFTFGDKVDSPTAVKLPLKLAIALLKDRHGVIDIDLPISGSLDDPQFRLGPLILKTLGNLIVKAVTAPFSLIARAFGGGDEESYLEFASGLSRVPPKGLTKLKGIAAALHERPGLSFEIQGLADPQSDKAGLRQELYERKLRAQKRRALAEAGQAAPAGDALVVDAGERPQLIEAAYRAETFPKPRAPNGAEKVLPPAEMEKLILANIRVEADELRDLALRRANAVRDALARAAPEAAARLFLLDPRTSTPGNRVQLTLKKD